MPPVTLPGSDVVVSRLIFGTASLFNAGSAASRARLLDAAHDHGFTHFDTAPLYGFGWAERDLAALLRRHADAGVTTKVGLYAPGGEGQSRMAVLLRKAAGRVAAPLSRAVVDLSLARARASLEASLRRLGRERIEICLLHEPNHALLAADEWQAWLEAERAAGRIGAFGIALDEVRLTPFLADPGPLTRLVQTADSLERREADALIRAGGQLQITYGYLAAARARGGAIDSGQVLRGALARNARGAIIVGTTRVERLRTLADAAESLA